ncbi:MAG: hypothetical protein ABW352_18525 [Polyangiales bacterium]
MIRKLLFVANMYVHEVNGIAVHRVPIANSTRRSPDSTAHFTPERQAADFLAVLGGRPTSHALSRALSTG